MLDTTVDVFLDRIKSQHVTNISILNKTECDTT